MTRTAPVSLGLPRHRGPAPAIRGGAMAPAKKSRSLRLEVMAAAALRSVGIAPCDHEGRDHHRILPARRQRRRPLRGAGGGTPRRRRPPATCHRADAAAGQAAAARGQGFRAVPLPCRPRPGRAAARLPELPARPAEPGDASRAAQAPDRGRSPGQPGHARRVRRGPGQPAGPARGRRVPDRPAVLRARLPARPARRGGRVAVAAAHPQPRRPDAGPVHGHRDRPARPRDPRRVAVGPRGGHGPLRPGPAQRRDPGRAGAGR